MSGELSISAWLQQVPAFVSGIFASVIVYHFTTKASQRKKEYRLVVASKRLVNLNRDNRSGLRTTVRKDILTGVDSDKDSYEVIDNINNHTIRITNTGNEVIESPGILVTVDAGCKIIETEFHPLARVGFSINHKIVEGGNSLECTPQFLNPGDSFEINALSVGGYGSNCKAIVSAPGLIAWIGPKQDAPKVSVERVLRYSGNYILGVTLAMNVFLIASNYDLSSGVIFWMIGAGVGLQLIALLINVFELESPTPVKGSYN